MIEDFEYITLFLIIGIALNATTKICYKKIEGIQRQKITEAETRAGEAQVREY